MAGGFVLREFGQLLYQMRPVVGNRVTWVMSEFVNGLDLKTALFKVLKQATISASAEAVGVREDDKRHAQEHTGKEGMGMLFRASYPRILNSAVA